MKLRMMFHLVPIVIMTITQADSFYVERFHRQSTAACNKEIKESRSYQTDNPGKTFHITSDKHDETLLSGKF